MTNRNERRADLEGKILTIFEFVQELDGLDSEGESRKKGIGKYSIKRALKLHDKNIKISINTIKKIVDDLLENGVIECINPGDKSGVRFRLREV